MDTDSAIDLPRAWGEPLASARIKSTPEDFIVREALDFEFDEQGEHLYLYVRKCGLNTSDIEEQLRGQFNCNSVDIGVSGLKDKNAVTDQWFSVRSPMDIKQTSFVMAEKDSTVPAGEFAILKTCRHNRKLRRGAHRHNRFIITLRQMAATDQEDARARIDDRLELIAKHGFANYFGPQRFGIGQQNLAKAERYFANPKRKMSRVQRSLVISSARSLLFNLVCAERVRRSTWNVPMAGEPMLLSGTHSFFVNDANADAANILERCNVHDVHPTGPLWGQGEMISAGDCQQLELDTVKSYKTFTDGLAKAGLKQQRRALRAGVEQLQWQWQGSEALTLEFNLSKGVYATSLLSELVSSA